MFTRYLKWWDAHPYLYFGMIGCAFFIVVSMEIYRYLRQKREPKKPASKALDNFLHPKA